MKKKVLSLLLALVMVFTILPLGVLAAPAEGGTLEAQWPSFRGNDQNNGITDARTPRTAEETRVKWTKTMPGGWSSAPSPVLLVGDRVISMVGTQMKAFNMDNGREVASADMAAATNWGSTPPLYADGKLFAQLSGSVVQAFDAQTLEVLWTYDDPTNGQAQSPITYNSGKVYVGLGYSAECPFVCLDAETGEVVWRNMIQAGFYWAGAVVVGDYVICGSDNGKLYSWDKLTGEQKGLLETGKGQIRSNVAAEGNDLYFTINKNTLTKVTLGADGSLNDPVYFDGKEAGTGTQSTSTPVIYDGLVYYGSGSGFSGPGYVSCVDMSTQTPTLNWAAEIPAGYVQSSVLLSTHYVDQGELYFYVTCNRNPGGVEVVRAKADGSGYLDVSNLYNAAGYEQYNICSVVADKEGSLYFKNDSCTIFALENKAPVPQPPQELTITDYGRSLSLDDEIYINNYVTIQGAEGIDLSTNAGLLIWDHAVTEDEALYGTETLNQVGLLQDSEGRYGQQTGGIAAKEYADSLYLRVYVQNTAGEYVYGPVKEASVRNYCEAILEKESSHLKPTAVQLLHFGAAAQIYFGYRVEDLANKNIAQQYPSKDWDPRMIETLAPIPQTDIVPQGVSVAGKSLSLNGRIQINFYFNPQGYEVDHGELLVWKEPQEALREDNTWKTVDLIMETTPSGRFAAQSPGFAAKEYNDTIFVCARMTDTEGHVHYSEIVAYSPNAYAQKALEVSSNEALKDAVRAMVLYGYEAWLFFENVS